MIGLCFWSVLSFEARVSVSIRVTAGPVQNVPVRNEPIAWRPVSLLSAISRTAPAWFLNTPAKCEVHRTVIENIKGQTDTWCVHLPLCVLEDGCFLCCPVALTEVQQ